MKYRSDRFEQLAIISPT